MLTSALPPQIWTLELAAGSQAQVQFVFTTPAPGGATPYPISGSTWEYVVRPAATSSGSPTFSVTSSGTSAGTIATTATTTLSQILLTVYPTATASLTPGAYAHGLWQNPGSATAFCWASGSLMINGTAQP